MGENFENFIGSKIEKKPSIGEVSRKNENRNEEVHYLPEVELNKVMDKGNAEYAQEFLQEISDMFLKSGMEPLDFHLLESEQKKDLMGRFREVIVEFRQEQHRKKEMAEK